ncbi:hypothetical protein [Pseudomonas syringae]|jgi:hypothetical protein|uniref:hypothetical protein n=1 Tax=Pseudomonas syringae TaxID=317 RepID=UPI0003523837|nr:hypothetical protein [Pseudomonas syringae]PHX52975.1 hypothetical protein AO354_20770 [Pseudomonas syringae pv. syringae]EPF65637.1 Hypothetical protein PssSM_1522 [Pseudomonas syringae pv. syringae SM]MBI6741328.1 hypothetical protein [Pseudomonas syringae]MBI6762565.1 hypothetical protein [Pseudomonas syringae]MBI6828220.1 hypothetical protein [Pseudomonas syringae]
MQLYHTTEEDLPIQSDREKERLRSDIEKAMADYLSRGGAINQVEASQRSSDSSFVINSEKTAQLKADTSTHGRKKTNDLTDTELARLLKAHCTAGASLASAAATLNQTRKRCEAIARRYQIPFRSAAFTKARARS